MYVTCMLSMLFMFYWTHTKCTNVRARQCPMCTCVVTQYPVWALNDLEVDAPSIHTKCIQCLKHCLVCTCV